ncbi:maleylpyruvate isomerase N-terminal domain-containing protein [Isoptericola sp. b441]|uniref:Maleylpyruvate isomerase family mycothiol-dependent enzyme n=2 Tax=Cellulomonadaceae TaxID=85016 RepID=A0A7Y0LUX6_CELFI|nr:MULTISPECIES: maleylpyruvate isomerase N-terminal domain-containing protein [Micrococcales]MDO8106391.1 maleylpyruvate isomerase N-terminal domain-containing protein [Isoptericola sp. b441]NMR18671.1 maleylpyruvate isomerase family mycothiol-dependent enzyme [Cellulomonas fimi]
MTQLHDDATPGQTPDATVGQAQVDALQASVRRLKDVVAAVPDHQLTTRAYPAEWTVSDVLSHLGSGAVITQRRLEDALAGQDTPAEFAPGVWDLWNAKGPEAQRDDALAADAELLERLEAVAAQERAAFASSMGPMTLDFAQFVGMRLNEHAFHTWDIEVVQNPAATIPGSAAELLVDNLELVARFTGQPTGDTATFAVLTTDPARAFVVELTPTSAVLTPQAAGTEAHDLTLPGEAFARLVYGRLDAAHTPTGVDADAALQKLRQAFPGP